MISIHSLRMEGDQYAEPISTKAMGFQSTPSAWRETCKPYCYFDNKYQFQSTPSAWRETFWGDGLLRSIYISIHSLRMEGDILHVFGKLPSLYISIHSLRMEGDLPSLGHRPRNMQFQSTPSAWRETAKLHRKAFFISPILVQSCKKGCKRLHSAPEKMVFFEKREKNLVRNLQHLSVRL